MRVLRRPWLGFWLAGAVLLCGVSGPPLWNRVLAAYDIHSARRLLSRAEPNEAIVRLKEAEGLPADPAEVQFLLATAHRRADLAMVAMQHLNRAGELGWSRKDLDRERWMLLCQTGEMKEAEPKLKKLLDQEVPDDLAVELYEALAKGYLIENRLYEALVCLSHWIEWRPENVTPRLWRAEVWRTMRDPAKEQVELEDILKIEPDNLAARATLAQSYWESNKVEEALEHYLLCRDLAPDSGGILLGIAHCQIRLGRLDEAQQAVEDARKRKLDKVQQTFAFITTGQIDLEKKRYQHAAESFEAAVKLTPMEATAYYGWGTALSKLGRKEEARKHIDYSLTLDKMRVQLEDLHRNLLGRPNDPELRYEAGQLNMALGQTQEAVHFWISALKHQPNHRKSHLALAEWYAKKGNAELAKRHRESAEESPEDSSAPTSPSDKFSSDAAAKADQVLSNPRNPAVPSGADSLLRDAPLK